MTKKKKKRKEKRENTLEKSHNKERGTRTFQVVTYYRVVSLSVGRRDLLVWGRSHGVCEGGGGVIWNFRDRSELRLSGEWDLCWAG